MPITDDAAVITNQNMLSLQENVSPTDDQEDDSCNPFLGNVNAGLRRVSDNTVLKRILSPCIAELEKVCNGAYKMENMVEKNVLMNKCSDFLTSFPWEVATQILLFLDVKTLVTMSAVCKAWYALSRSNDIWRNRLKDMQWSVQVPKEFSQSKDRLDWHYIYKQKYQLEQRWATGRLHARYMFGHRESVYCVRFDDDVIISGSRDYTIKIWSTKTYECIRTLHGHDGSVLCLQFDKEKIISGSSDKTIIIWSLETFQILKRLRVIHNLAFSRKASSRLPKNNV